MDGWMELSLPPILFQIRIEHSALMLLTYQDIVLQFCPIKLLQPPQKLYKFTDVANKNDEFDIFFGITFRNDRIVRMAATCLKSNMQQLKT
eukprot:scaffold537397_cov15-Prasinocladus_malaysianus.AAC.1